MGIIQPDVGDLHRFQSENKSLEYFALQLQKRKEKPEHENMVKKYIVVASVLLGSMLAGHAHAVTAPHATLRKLQQDNYGDWYDPYGVDTDDDYYSDGTGTFYLYPSAAVDGVVDTAVDVAGDVVSNVASDAIDTVTGGLLNGLGR